MAVMKIVIGQWRRNGASSCGGLRAFKALAPAVCILTLLALALICGPALAGTEDGSFCPTCPDWTDLDGWMAKKAAYDQGQIPPDLVKGSKASKTPAATLGSSSNAANVAKGQGYARPDLMAFADSSMEGRVLLDSRSPEDYAQGHIPGARNLYWKDISPSDKLDPALAEVALRKIGVNNSDSIIVYGGSDYDASRLFWALSLLGQDKVSKLNGGIQAWTEEGKSLERSMPAFGESNYTAVTVPWLEVGQDEIETWLDRNDLQVLDARDFTEYGRSRLTNTSIQIQVDKIYEGDFLVASPEELDGIFEGRGLSPDSVQLVYGTPKAYSLFYALKLAGYNATLIDGSWWSKTRWAVSNIR
jgi:thiosulfate/3-mercaptopyruvate sulfurtransferase